MGLNEITMTVAIKHLRVMASRGRIDDADVQLLFDIADFLEGVNRRALEH